jgi:TRAP-type mannitol/chloroaromatic compound transport system substrate-binding protein
MKRRSFLSGASAGVAATAIAAPAVAKAAADTTWRLAQAFPSALETQYQAVGLIARRVAELTGGRFRIETGDGAVNVLDAVSAGRVEIGYATSYDYVDRDPAFAFDTALPFGLNARQQTAWMLFGGGDALLGELFAGHNIHRLAAGNTGARMGGWFTRPILEPEDFKGLRIRAAGVAGDVLARLGAAPRPMRYYYYPGWWEGGAQLSLYVNADAWGRLPDGFRHALAAAAAEADRWTMAKYDAESPAALRRLLADGAELRAFPRHVQLAGYDAALAVYADYAARSERFARIYENWSRFQRDENQWFRVAEDTFDNFVFTATATAAMA